MIESILQIIGMLTIVLGLAALIVAEIYRHEFISDLRYDCDLLIKGTNELSERISNIEGKLK
jgi:hypothetical protein